MIENKIKNENNKNKLDHPVKVYFNSSDYELLNDIANQNGLDMPNFIRNKMKLIIREESNKERTLTMSLSNGSTDKKSLFNNQILKLSFCEVQLHNTADINTKNIILENMKKLINDLLNLLNEYAQKKYKDNLYTLSVEDIIKLNLEKYL